MKQKCIHTVCVDNYFPELSQYTLANLEQYAKKIGADFNVITTRKFPDFPPTYEKLQVHELGARYHWNILVDADCMFHPAMFDPTQIQPMDYVCTQEEFDASLLFEVDQYFMRDGRKKGLASNFVISHITCHDLWTPLEMTWAEARTKTKREFIIDEYCISRNLARFGLKNSGILGPELVHLFKHFDVNSKSPDKDQVVQLAKKYHEEWKWK
jgi:hypothetical protein